MKLPPSLLICLCLIPNSIGHNILVLTPFAFYSHQLTIRALATGLADRGHQITTIRFESEPHFKLPPIQHNHTEITLYLNNTYGTVNYVTVGERGRIVNPEDMLWRSGLGLAIFGEILNDPWRICEAMCQVLLGEVYEQLKSSTFDVAIVDLLFNECSLALADKLGVPSVAFWGAGGEIEFTTASLLPSFVPALSSELPDRMTFVQRMINLSYKTIYRLFMELHAWRIDSFIQRIHPGSPTSRDLIGNLSGMLLNTHPLLDYPRPMPSTFIDIGGLQVAEKNKPLPAEIESFLSASPSSGVILFSLGSALHSMPNSTLSAFLEAFRLLPQYRIIVARINIPEEAKPANVITMSFAPQQDILADPRTKAFISHCGTHGVLEAVYHSVPIVCMPVFHDQGDFCARIERKRIGMSITKYSTAEQIYNAIWTILNDESYSDRMSSLSQLMRLRRTTPMEDAIWLVEYVAQTKGADHLKLASRHLNDLQYYCLDILAFSIAMALVTHFLIKGMFKKSKSK